MVQIADFIDRAIQNRRKENELAKISDEVSTLCEKFPLYKERQEG